MASESPYPTTIQVRPVATPLVILASNMLQNESDLVCHSPTLYRFGLMCAMLELEKHSAQGYKYCVQ